MKSFEISSVLLRNELKSFFYVYINVAPGTRIGGIEINGGKKVLFHVIFNFRQCSPLAGHTYVFIISA